MAQYKIFAVEPMGFPTVPLIVTAAYTNHGGYPRGEWFLAIPDDADSFFGGRITYSYKSFPQGPFSLSEDVILREALDEAKLRLRRYLFEKRTGGFPIAGFREADVREDNKNLFMHYWLMGQCMTQLERISKATQFQALEMDLHHVLQLPRPTTANID